MLNMQNIFFIVIFSDIKMKNVYLMKTHFFQYIWYLKLECFWIFPSYDKEQKSYDKKSYF